MEETSQFVPNNYGIQNIYYGTVINVYYNEYRMCDSAYNTCRESTTVEDDEIFEEDAPQDGELIEKLKPIFYNNEEDVRLFLKEIKVFYLSFSVVFKRKVHLNYIVYNVMKIELSYYFCTLPAIYTK